MEAFLRLLRKINLPVEAIEKSFLWRYGSATVFVALAFIARDSLTPILHDQLPFTFLTISSIVAAYIGGLGPGIYALVVGWLLADYFFVPPLYILGSYGKIETISLVSTLAPALLAILLIELLHTTRRRARSELAARKKAESELVKAKDHLEQSNAELEQRVAERTAELEESVRFLEGFCYSIAHDLRAPLRAMQGFVTALEQDYALEADETSREYSRRIVGASQKMDKLILDLLEYGRLSHTKLNVEDVSMEATVASTLASLHETIATRGGEINIRHPLDDVHADATLIKSILFHLLDNALKFSRPGVKPRIDIWTESEGNRIRFFIHDNGIGIAPEYRERIFRLFETLEPATSTTTGAGLAVASKAVQRMHGKIGVDSEKGQGSTFWVELPRATSGTAALHPENLVTT